MTSNDSNTQTAEHGVAHQVVDTVILTYNRATDHLEVGGKANSLDLMLDMLARATRAIEKQKRIADMIEFQQAHPLTPAAARFAALLKKNPSCV